MNSSIENLNQWGGQFLNFAWPMAWQSGVLIAALLAFDFLFRRQLRASVRYALWLVVLVKLILPPALALPTSPAWWLHLNQPAVLAKPLIQNYTVSYDSSPLPAPSLNTLTAFVPPKPVMTLAAWLLVLSAAISAGLFAWLLVRWWQITRQVSVAWSSSRLTAIAAKSQLLAGVRGQPPVKLTGNTMSPAVCGLFYPAILIPQALAEHFSDEQLRAVLLHELIHVRRRDVWLNFCQSLLQIVYWWHPLVWLANARIRRVREEAVDDAVMLALAGEAETYAPTLLEVAKLALNRPLASLGLVGILESRSALRERIERLVDFRAPRRAGLTLVSFFGVLAFSAVAVPMGGAPGSTEETAPEISGVPSSVMAVPKTNAPAILVTSYFYRLPEGDFKAMVSNLKFKQSKTTNDPYWAATPEDFSQLIKNLKSSGQQLYLSPRIVTGSGIEAATYIGDETNRGSGLDVRPVIDGESVDMRIIGDVVWKSGDIPVTNRFVTTAAMENSSGIVMRPNGKENDLLVAIGIQILTNGYHERLEGTINKAKPSAEDVAKAASLVQDGKVYYEMGKLDESEAVLKSALALNPDNAAAKYYLRLIEEAQAERHGTTFVLPAHRRPPSLDKINQIQIDQFGPFVNAPLGQVMHELSEAAKRSDPEKQGVVFLIGSPLGNPAKPPLDVNSVFVNLPSVLKQVKLGNVLDAIKNGSSGPINFTFMDDKIVLSAKSPPGKDSPLYQREYEADKVVFSYGLQKQTGLTPKSPTDVAIAARSYFSKLGIDWGSPQGKSVFYNDRLGRLYVKATESDLDLIDRAMPALMVGIWPQVHIRARFFEVPKGTLVGMGKIMVLTNQTDQGTGMIGILTSENFKTTLQNLERLPGAEELAEPEVTTITGRQAEMKATELITVVTNFTFPPPMTNLPVISTPSPPPAGGYRVDGSAITPQSIQIETGPILHAFSYVLSDGYTIELTSDASLTQFLGYSPITDTPVNYPLPAGSPGNLPMHPAFQVLRSRACINLWDQQTLVMAIKVPPTSDTSLVPVLGDIPLVGNLFQNQRKTKPEKELIVFVTVTIVDAAGNRIHAEDELPFAENGIPPQPPQ
jgi:beta-lactamase regulating signal transducer with metallopeptidase domain/tetratricopeptide (TPR) repeat protein